MLNTFKNNNLLHSIRNKYNANIFTDFFVACYVTFTGSQ